MSTDIQVLDGLHVFFHFVVPRLRKLNAEVFGIIVCGQTTQVEVGKGAMREE
jgi:hypothetical protein